jgi:hypothetical protein
LSAGTNYRRALASGGPAAASALLLDHAKPFDLGEYLAAREREGVVAEIALGAPGTPNDHVIDLARQAPGRIHAWAGLSLTDADAALAELRRCLQAGATGVFIAPVLDGIDITHHRFADVLGLAAERHLALYLHTGKHFVRAQPLDITTWRHVDTLASRHPDLRIVCAHAGWPWVLETLLVAARHDNVYLDISGHRPSRMATPGFGWEPLITLGASSLRHRILFGTCTWLTPQPANLLATEITDRRSPRDRASPSALAGHPAAAAGPPGGRRLPAPPRPGRGDVRGQHARPARLAGSAQGGSPDRPRRCSGAGLAGRRHPRGQL